MLVLNLISSLGDAGRLDEAMTRLDQLRNFVDRHLDEPELELPLVWASITLIGTLGSAKQLDEAREQLNLLCDFTRRYQADSKIVGWVGTCTFLLTVDYINQGNSEGAVALARDASDLLRSAALQVDLCEQLGDDGAATVTQWIQSLLAGA